MIQVQRIVTLALALMLIAVPAVVMAQGTTSSPATAGQDNKAAPADKSADKATDKPASEKPVAPSASPSTSGAAPMSADDCKNNGWQKFGLKSEAECSSKITK